ncbi:hypothetical protein GMOD_00004784 [Pyrenophora seminiperda CCB06]|uniref:Uncharacterized protein n=1 Tax=Pyrenophora seminiperda CCB06 TaxID=1302712 RepID=A0A3M7MHY6_9PLEO|nr:hypothetical protein GMOD_00004784 [Pyrenophora seminiperda CCB06]
MKVVEQHSDRQALAHIYVQGSIAGLEEYGQYVDPNDSKTICCYVPIDEGDTAKVRIWFSGITLAISYDALVDGTLRKTNSYVAKTVTQQRNRRFDIDKFLYKTDKGVQDTDIIASQLLDIALTQSDTPESFGTIELRLYVTRQLDTFHDIRDVRTYDTNVKDDEKDSAQTATYKLIPPSLKMDFEENCLPLEAHDVQRELRRLNAKRPGTEPWAIFRFHYRTREQIDKQKLKLTYDPADKADELKPHTLVLSPILSPLILGTKPQKNDVDTTSRTSSPMISVTSHPVKGAQMNPVPLPKRPTLATNELNPESKRPKMATGSRPLTPKTVSVARRLVEQQKRLEELQKKRIDQAREQVKVDEQIKPYKELMAAELERLKNDILEEECAYKEDMEHYKASIEVLRKFKEANGNA